MKKNIKIIAAALIMLISLFSLAGCGNRQIIDLTYTYHTALIDMLDGTVKEIEIASWTDYRDGDQIQIKDIDGNTYLVHSSRCILMT